MRPAWGEWYARELYPYVARVLRAFSSLFPFSVGDLFIYGSLLGLVAYLFYTLYRRRGGWRMIRQMVEYVAWVYLWFYAAWGLNYFRQDFFIRSATPRVSYSAERFESFLVRYTEALNAAYLPELTMEEEAVREAVVTGYHTLPAEWGVMRPSVQSRAKRMGCSRLMSAVGVMGYMGPFFCEFHLSSQLLPVQIPATYAHELAHTLSVTNEAEANLCSYWVCTHSDQPAVRFSGYFSLLPYVLSNARAALSPADFKVWIDRLRPEVKQLYNEKVSYWQALYNPWIGEAQHALYNLFLKGNRIASGTANYAEVISLLIAWEDRMVNT